MRAPPATGDAEEKVSVSESGDLRIVPGLGALGLAARPEQRSGTRAVVSRATVQRLLGRFAIVELQTPWRLFGPSM